MHVPAQQFRPELPGITWNYPELGVPGRSVSVGFIKHLSRNWDWLGLNPPAQRAPALILELSIMWGANPNIWNPNPGTWIRIQFKRPRIQICGVKIKNWPCLHTGIFPNLYSSDTWILYFTFLSMFRQTYMIDLHILTCGSLPLTIMLDVRIKFHSS